MVMRQYCKVVVVVCVKGGGVTAGRESVAWEEAPVGGTRGKLRGGRLVDPLQPCGPGSSKQHCAEPWQHGVRRLQAGRPQAVPGGHRRGGWVTRLGGGRRASSRSRRSTVQRRPAGGCPPVRAGSGAAGGRWQASVLEGQAREWLEGRRAAGSAAAGALSFMAFWSPHLARLQPLLDEAVQVSEAAALHPLHAQHARRAQRGERGRRRHVGPPGHARREARRVGGLVPEVQLILQLPGEGEAECQGGRGWLEREAGSTRSRVWHHPCMSCSLRDLEGPTSLALRAGSASRRWDSILWASAAQQQSKTCAALWPSLLQLLEEPAPRGGREQAVPRVCQNQHGRQVSFHAGAQPGVLQGNTWWVPDLNSAGCAPGYCPAPRHGRRARQARTAGLVRTQQSDTAPLRIAASSNIYNQRVSCPLACTLTATWVPSCSRALCTCAPRGAARAGSRLGGRARKRADAPMRRRLCPAARASACALHSPRCVMACRGARSQLLLRLPHLSQRGCSGGSRVKL